MKTVNTTAIVLKRTNYREADRIVRAITPDKGRVSFIAKGVRKPKSKLAGGIEPFSVNDISYVEGSGDLATLISSRSHKSFRNITKNVDRTMRGHEFISMVDRSVEQHAGQEFYELLLKTLEALDNFEIPLELAEAWFIANFLEASGRSPNLMTDSKGEKLSTGYKYDFDLESMTFIENKAGNINPNQIKFCRLLTQKSPNQLISVLGFQELVPNARDLFTKIYKSNI